MSARCLLLLLALAIYVSAPHPAAAEGLKVSPIRIYFEEQQKTQTLTLHNEGDEPVTLQFEQMEWSQDAEGRDAYAPTQAIVLFPKIVTVGAHTDQLIRLGYQGPAPTDQERAYRLYLTELPVSTPGETTLKMAMRLGLPVFISPAEGRPTLEIAGMGVSQAVAQLQVKNTGRHHAYLETIHVVGRAASGSEVFTTDASGWYVLPGSQRTFPIELPDSECARAATLQFSLEFSNRDLDQPAVTSTASVTPSDCSGSAR